MNRAFPSSVCALVAGVAFIACGSSATGPAPGSQDAAGPDLWSVRDTGEKGGDTRDVGVGGDAVATGVTVNVAAPRAISPFLFGQNYYNWIPAWGAQVFGVEDLVVPLQLNLLREGGTPSDTSTPMMFDFGQIDTFAGYAARVGATPLLQIPFVGIRDLDGNLAPATSQNAASMVRYANISRGYGIRYFSIGNEPDLYEEQGRTLGGQSTSGYTPEQFCKSFSEYVSAMKAEDPTIRIVGPELSWKYKSGDDWLSPFLAGCGKLVDVVTVHLYPFSADKDTAQAVLGDANYFRSVIRGVRDLMSEAGFDDKPLGITESHVTWDSDPAKPQLSGAPGTIAAGLWIADVLGVAMEENLWTLAFWSLAEDWTISFIDGRSPKPEYYALMMVSQHFRSASAKVTGAPAGVSVYAGRHEKTTPVLLINKTESKQDVTVSIAGATTPVTPLVVPLPPLSLVVLEVPDDGMASAWVYGEAQHKLGIGIQTLSLASGATTSPADAAASPAADGGAEISCGAEMPNSEGQLAIDDGYVVAGPAHGFASAWSSKSDATNAVACTVPICTAASAPLLIRSSETGAAPLTSAPVSCSPRFGPSALCTAGMVGKDPTYNAIAGLGFNLQQGSATDVVDGGGDGGSGELGSLTIPKSMTVTVETPRAALGNIALRVQLTDVNDQHFCALEGTWTSGRPIPITHFNTRCWDGTGISATPTMSFKRVDIVVGSVRSVDRPFVYCLTDIKLE